MRTGLALCLAVLLLAGLAAGCTSPGAQPTSGPARTQALADLLQHATSHGKIDRATALQAYSLAFKPLPGVTAPRAASGDHLLDGSGPLRWLIPYLDTLTAEQRNAVLAAVPRPKPKTARSDGLTLLAGSEQAQFEALVHKAMADFGARLGPLRVPVTVTLNSVNADKDEAYAYVAPRDAGGRFAGDIDECDIFFNPEARSASDDVKREAAYHEVFHCYQAQAYGNLDAFYHGPKWLIEGGAQYVGDEAAGAGPISKGWWKFYFATPQNALFDRSYDANGFFAHLANLGGDPEGAMPAAVAAVKSGGDEAALNGFLQGTSGVLDSWAPSLVRKPELGKDWDTAATGITADRISAAPAALGPGATLSGSVVRYANDDRRLQLSAEVTVVAAVQHGRLKAINGATDMASPNGVFCTRPGGGCSCPSGSPREGTKFTDLAPGDYYLAISGAADGLSWQTAAFTLADFCRRSPVDSCLLGTWNLTQPPVLPNTHTTFDHITEIATFNSDGTLIYKTDIGAHADVVTVTAIGNQTIKVLTIAGNIQPLTSDDSGIKVTATMGGTVLFQGSFGQLLPGYDQQLTPVAYTCLGNFLTLWGSTGLVWGFTKG